MFGLILSDPPCDPVLRKSAADLLAAQDIPLSGFTDAPAPLFLPPPNRTRFLRLAAHALMRPGTPVSAAAVLAHLSGDALPGNVLRRYTFLQLSLMPYLRPGRTITELEGCFLLGDDVLVVPVREDDTVDVLLPPGVWSEFTGCTWQGRFRQVRGVSELPVLLRANALIPIGVNDRTPDANDADRLTLHWFQPQSSAQCVLKDGTRYLTLSDASGFRVQSDSPLIFHLIVHQDGEEILIK